MGTLSWKFWEYTEINIIFSEKKKQLVNYYLTINDFFFHKMCVLGKTLLSSLLTFEGVIHQDLLNSKCKLDVEPNLLYEIACITVLGVHI